MGTTAFVRLTDLESTRNKSVIVRLVGAHYQDASGASSVSADKQEKAQLKLVRKCSAKQFPRPAAFPAPEGEPNYLAHMACAERGITHMECLANLDKLVGRGRFRFIGFPLKIRGGTASPIRAVAVFD